MNRVWLFEADGTGHTWYGAEDETGPIEGDVSFVWTVDDGKLVVDDLPPAVVVIPASTHLLIEPIDGRALEAGIVWSRCTVELPNES